jgi:hypothetical protein
MGKIRFMIAGDLEYSEKRPETFVELDEENSNDLLHWLGMEPDNFGCVEASDLAARCRRRLWPMARNVDPEIAPHSERSGGSAIRLMVGGRPEGYLHARTEELLKLAERAGFEGQILFS